MTIVGRHDFVNVSMSASFKSFLLIICIDAPESTTISLSSGPRVDGAGRHQFSGGEKNAVLCFSFNFWIFCASFHAASRAHRSCHSVSFWDRSSNFGALGSRWWGSPWQLIPSEGFWSRMSTAFVNFTHWIGFRMSELFREIDEDFGEYATHMSCIWWVSILNRSPCSMVMLILLQHSHCTFWNDFFIRGPFLNADSFAWILMECWKCEQVMSRSTSLNLAGRCRSKLRTLLGVAAPS